MSHFVHLSEKLLQIILPILTLPRSSLPLATEVQAEPIMPPDAATVALLKRQRNEIIQPLELDKHRLLLCASLNPPRGRNSIVITRMLRNNPPASRIQSVS